MEDPQSMLKEQRRERVELPPAPSYWVIVTGVGMLYDAKLRSTLDQLGPANQRILLDSNPSRVSAETVESQVQHLVHGVIADSRQAPFSLDNGSLTPEQKRNFVVFVGTPDHLHTIESFVSAGFRRFVVEKPMVNNGEEVRVLESLKERYPDLMVYPMDFYVQKVAPLYVLTGALTPSDPRWEWVTDAYGNPVSEDLAGSLTDWIGQLEGISVNILEGGSLGVPNVRERIWLLEDLERGGMWLDLGTHALAPLAAAGLFSASTTNIDDAGRLGLNAEMNDYVPVPDKQTEMQGDALLTSTMTGRPIHLAVRVGKTFDAGGIWELTLRGDKGHIFMGLRTGDRLTVIPKDQEPFQLRLRAGVDPYELAMQEAHWYFSGVAGIDGNMQAMLDAIAIIDRIKAASPA